MGGRKRKKKEKKERKKKHLIFSKNFFFFFIISYIFISTNQKKYMLALHFTIDLYFTHLNINTFLNNELQSTSGFPDA